MKICLLTKSGLLALKIDRITQKNLAIFNNLSFISYES